MIITHQHIDLYKKVGGDVDHLQRVGTDKESSLINQEIIFEIGELVSDLELINNGLASKLFQKRINDKLIAVCEDIIVVEKIKGL